MIRNSRVLVLSGFGMFLFLFLFLFQSLSTASAVESAENWPCWRGPRGDGTSLQSNVPTSWNGNTGQNIHWKRAIDGTGHSSPIVWNDRVFVTSCLEDSGQRMLFCLDRRTGELIWQRAVLESPLERKHKLNSFASGTPATDGRLVYVSFLEPDFGSAMERTPGDMVVAAYDFDGRQHWLARPGRFASVHGFCSSPVLYQDKVIVNGDHDGDAYIAALDRRTGQTVWKIERDRKTRSYVTPIIRKFDGRTQMILSGSKCVASYDPDDGSQHWIIDGPTEQFVASVVDDGKLLFVSAGFPEHHILAIRPDGSGDVTGSHIVWRTTRGCSYVPSPIVVDSYLIVAADNGIVTCFDTATGQVHWRERLARHYSASLVAAGRLVYLLDDDGITKVVRPGPQLQVIAENPLGEYCYASPAMADAQLLIRGQQHLYSITPTGGGHP